MDKRFRAVRTRPARSNRSAYLLRSRRGARRVDVGGQRRPAAGRPGCGPRRGQGDRNRRPRCQPHHRHQQGHVKIDSSWPMTAASEQIGGDAVEAVRMASRTSATRPAASRWSTSRSTMQSPPTTAVGMPARSRRTPTRSINDADAMVYMATYNSGAAKISIPILKGRFGRDGDDLLCQHLPGADQGGRGRHGGGRAGEVLPDRQAQLHARPPGRRNPGRRRRQLGVQQVGREEGVRAPRQPALRQGRRQGLRDEFEKLGGEVLGFEGYDPNAGRLHVADDLDRRHRHRTSSTSARSSTTTPARCCRTCAR